MRLWELEGGDDAEAGIGYEGGAAVQDAGQYGQHLELVEEQFAEDDSGDESDEADLELEEAPVAAPRQQPRPAPGQPQAPRELANGRFAVAREGPLVLRLEDNARQVNAPPAPVEVERRRHPGIPNARGQRGGRGNGEDRRAFAAAVMAAAAEIDRHRHRHRQNLNQLQGQNQQLHNNGRNDQNGMGDVDGDEVRGDGQLNDQDAAWIRQFVQLALNDMEDSDDE